MITVRRRPDFEWTFTAVRLYRMQIAALLLLFTIGPAAASEDGCADCHRSLDGAAGLAARQFAASVHGQAGMTCSSCHEGSPHATRSEDAKRRGFLARPRFSTIPDLCGRCHSSPDYMRRYNPAAHVDQEKQYRASVHGMRSARGDTNVATCTSCHSVHEIRRVDDPLSPVHMDRLAETCGACHSDPARMGRYGLATNIVERYRASAHGKALHTPESPSAPSCNHCHGDHGASHPEAESVANICGTCHLRQRDLFARSGHSGIFASRKLHGCVTCHDPHASEPARESFQRGVPETCASCHHSPDQSRALNELADGFSTLAHKIRFTDEFLLDVEKGGIDVRTSRDHLEEAGRSLETSRMLLHALETDRVLASLELGFFATTRAHKEAAKVIEAVEERSRSRYLLLAIGGVSAVLGGLLLVRSISARRRELKELQQERQRVEQSRQRLARVGEISAGLAHTIRNPLHGVLNCVDILKAKIPPNNGCQDTLALMSEGLKRIQGVTQRLLVLTRETNLERVPTDVTELARDALRFIEVKCQRQSVSFDLSLESVPSLMVDPNQFSEALLNVLDNAVDACSLGGKITVRISAACHGREVAIEVSDTGEGIPPESLSKVFDPFFTSKPIGEGTGLGLAITRRIIEDHGGKVRIESSPGTGTRVLFRLPAAASTMIRTAGEGSPAADDSKGPNRV